MTGSYDLAYLLDMGGRVALAVLAGAVIGINRDMHKKSIGLRTLGLVSLSACLLVLTVTEYGRAHGLNTEDAMSRVTQGLIQGIGFLGAGAIMRGADQTQVYGLTTASAILVVAALGVSCAVAAWPILILGISGTLFLLVVCTPLERAVQRRFDRTRPPDSHKAG